MGQESVLGNSDKWLLVTTLPSLILVSGDIPPLVSTGVQSNSFLIFMTSTQRRGDSYDQEGLCSSCTPVAPFPRSGATASGHSGFSHLPVGLWQCAICGCALEELLELDHAIVRTLADTP